MSQVDLFIGAIDDQKQIIAGIAHEKKALAEGTQSKTSTRPAQVSMETMNKVLRLSGALQREMLDLAKAKTLGPEVMESLESEVDIAKEYVKRGDVQGLEELVKKVKDMTRVTAVPSGNLPN